MALDGPENYQFAEDIDQATYDALRSDPQASRVLDALQKGSMRQVNSILGGGALGLIGGTVGGLAIESIPAAGIGRKLRNVGAFATPGLGAMAGILAGAGLGNAIAPSAIKGLTQEDVDHFISKSDEAYANAKASVINKDATAIADEIMKEALLGVASGLGSKAWGVAKGVGTGVRNYMDNVTGSNLRAAKRFESVQNKLVDDAGKAMANSGGLPSKAVMDEAKAHQIGLQKATQGVKDAQTATNKARLATGAAVGTVAAGTAGAATVNAVRERARQIEESKGRNYQEGYEFQ